MPGLRAAVLGLLVGACASASPAPEPAGTPCENPVLVVRNNSNATVEVVEIRPGDMESRAIGIVTAGSTQTFDIRGSNAPRYNTREPGTRGSGLRQQLGPFESRNRPAVPLIRQPARGSACARLCLTS